jgi:hypothetical protein
MPTCPMAGSWDLYEWSQRTRLTEPLIEWGNWVTRGLMKEEEKLKKGSDRRVNLNLDLI